MNNHPPDDWDIRGELASGLTCWHRLSSMEAAELVQYVTELHLLISKKSDAIQRIWRERDDLASQVSSLNVGFNNCQTERNRLREFVQYIRRTGDERLSAMAADAMEENT